MPEKSAVMSQHNFCLKPKVNLEYTDITQETRKNDQTYSKNMMTL